MRGIVKKHSQFQWKDDPFGERSPGKQKQTPPQERNGTELNGTNKPSASPPVDFRDDIWDWVRKNYDAPKGRTVWKSAREAWIKTIKRGADPEDLGRAIHHYQQSTSREFRIGLQRFLNTKEPWREWVDGPEVKSDGLPPAVNADDLKLEV